MKNEDKFLVSLNDAEKIASLFKKGISDYTSIVKELKWDKKMQNHLLQYMIGMNFIDMDLIEKQLPIILSDENIETNEELKLIDPYRVAKDRYSEFLQNLPVDYPDDFWDAEDYKDLYKQTRAFLVRLLERNKEKSKLFDYKESCRLIASVFNPYNPKPKDATEKVIELSKIRLQKMKKDQFTSFDILDTFDKSFAIFIT